MKYKLLKDLPGYKAGTVFIIDASGTYAEDDVTLDWLPKLLNDYKDDTEFFQPIDDKPERPSRWRAEEHDYFYYLDEYLDIVTTREDWRESSKLFTDKQHDIGNYFRTEQQAEAAAEAVRRVLGLIQTGTTPDSREQWDAVMLPVVEALEAAMRAAQEGRA
jgi:uncharacterized circularly permuted ATP-grasp superfamily protein